mmetsp:Transcript_3790/g.10892  ORF Transcript_3790/g.10892 Transcript_3790/m.10892 type:complete len:201 (+) Transcript_3790:688-1290(+)
MLKGRAFKSKAALENWKSIRLFGPLGGVLSLFPRKGSPWPLLGTNPALGLLSVTASASTFSTPTLSPKTTTLSTLGCRPSRSMSWYIEKVSIPVNARWMGEDVPGLVVNSSFHRPLIRSLAVGSLTPPSSSSFATHSSITRLSSGPMLSSLLVLPSKRASLNLFSATGFPDVEAAGSRALVLIKDPARRCTACDPTNSLR